MNIVLLCNRSKPEVDQVAEIIASNGHVVTLSDKAPDAEFLSQFDLGVSWFYRSILKSEHINAVRLGVLNCHIGFLPFGRGADPAVWSIINHEPAGVSIHWIDSGVDTGPLVAREYTKKYITDTREDLYKRLTADMLELFKRTWELMERFDFELPTIAQQIDGYVTRKTGDTKRLCNLESHYGRQWAHEFVDILRATSFPGKPSAYITDSDGKKIYVRVTLEKES